MIHFRFHVVSIIAIFLAIAIGTVMGATFVGRGVIDNLQTRIDRVQANAEDERAENSALQGQIDDANKYIDESAGLAVDRTLTGVRIELIAERGVDGGQVDAQAALAADRRGDGAGDRVARGALGPRHAGRGLGAADGHGPGQPLPAVAAQRRRPAARPAARLATTARRRPRQARGREVRDPDRRGREHRAGPGRLHRRGRAHPRRRWPHVRGPGLHGDRPRRAARWASAAPPRSGRCSRRPTR